MNCFARKCDVGAVVGMMAGAMMVLAACSSATVTSSQQAAPGDGSALVAPPTATVTVVPTVDSKPTVAPTAMPATPAAATEITAHDRADWALAVAGYAPFNFDGQDGVGPGMFGIDATAQEQGYACYQTRLGELVDIPALVARVEGIDGYFDLLPAEALGARQAVADCLNAEDYRDRWIAAKVFGWNEYARAGSDPALSSSHQCFAPVFESPEAFAEALVAEGSFRNEGPGIFGPFDCRAAIGVPILPTPQATPPIPPWYECDTVDFALQADYRVVNIPADDPDGGLVAHVAPGVDVAVTEVIPDGTDNLRVSGCQRNLNNDAVWWLVEERGWVNAYYLGVHVPLESAWQTALSEPFESDWFASLIGLEAEDLDTLGSSIGETLTVSEGEMTVYQVGDFVGIDAQGGYAAYDVLGLTDDSVAGYRLGLTLEFVKDDTATDILAFRIHHVAGRAICSRGVGDSGLCI